MEQRMSILTVGVKDLSAVRAFYEEKFGWKPVAANKDIVFFRLNGMLLSFFGRTELAAGAGLPPPGEVKPGAFALAYLVRTESETDELFTRLGKAGVRILMKPTKTPFGAYVGAVADVEGNVWELGTNPFVELDAQGSAVGHRDISKL